MATRRSFLAGVTGLVGGAALERYTDVPDRVLPPDAPALPVAFRPDTESRPPPSPPENSTFSDEQRERAREVGLAAREAVVFLQLSAGGSSYYAGTGWILDDERIVTNGHVVERGGEITCYTVGGETLPVELVEASRDPDVALLRTEEAVPASLPTGSSEDLNSDQPLLHVGHPSGVGNWIVALGRYDGRPGFFGGDVLQSTVPGTRGNSGSPLLTLEGNAVGTTFASTSRGQRNPGSAPEPTDEHVREAYRLDATSLHVTSEAVERLVAKWS